MKQTTLHTGVILFIFLFFSAPPLFSQDESVKEYTGERGEKIKIVTSGNRIVTTIQEGNKTIITETVDGKVVKTTTSSFTTSGGSPGTPQTAPDYSERKNDEDTAVLSGKIGYGYFNWIISPLQRKIEGDSGSFTYKTDPYLVKRIDLAARIFFLQAGAEYLTNKLNEWGGFSKEKLSAKDVDAAEGNRGKLLRQIFAFGGFKIGDTNLKAEILLRQFNSEMISRGVSDTGLILRYPAYYYNANGDPLLMTPGSSIRWNSLYQQYTLKKMSYLNKYFTHEMGLQYAVYDAPTQYRITSRTASFVPPLMIHSKIQAYYFIAGLRIRNYFGEYVYLQTYMPGTIGVSRFTNALLKTQYGYAFSTRANVSLNFATSFFHAEAGAEGACNTMSTYSTGGKVKKDILIPTNTGTTAFIRRTDSISYTSMRDEVFWGLFAKAGIFF